MRKIDPIAIRLTELIAQIMRELDTVLIESPGRESTVYAWFHEAALAQDKLYDEVHGTTEPWRKQQTSQSLK